MKTKIFLLFILVGSGLFYSCDNDDDDLVVSDKHTAAFNSLYPQAQNVSWEKKGITMLPIFGEVICTRKPKPGLMMQPNG